MVTVLIADDEPSIVELVRITLEDERIEVMEALDGETAVAMAGLFHPALVLLDVQLPDLSGLEVCRRIRADQRLQSTRIIMLTAAAQPEDMARGLAAGADHYLTKPFSPIQLLGLVGRLLPEASLWLPG